MASNLAKTVYGEDQQTKDAINSAGSRKKHEKVGGGASAPTSPIRELNTLSRKVRNPKDLSHIIPAFEMFHILNSMLDTWLYALYIINQITYT